MKSYRYLIAVGMVVLMGFSIYSLISAAVDKSTKINALKQEAIVHAEQGLINKAVGTYGEIIKLDPSVTYYCEIIELYYNSGDIENSISWGEDTIDGFPEEVVGYEKLLRSYIDYEKYSSAYELLEIVDGRGLKSEVIEQYRSAIQYRYYLEYVGIDAARQPSNSIVAVNQSEKWGFMTTQGKNVTRSIYADVGYFGNGVAPVLTEDGIWYFIDEEGEYVDNISHHIQGNIETIGLYNDEFFPVNIAGVYSYYNMNFEYQFGEFDYAGAFNLGVAAVKKGEIWYLINNSGERVSEENFDEVILDDRGVCCMQERILVKKDGMFYIVDSNGKRISDVAFEDAGTMTSGELIAVKQNGKWGFSDLDGNIVIAPEYEAAKSFANGLGAVYIEGLWGYIDENNNLCIPATFITCTSIGSNGAAVVNTERGWNLLKLYSKNY